MAEINRSNAGEREPEERKDGMKIVSTGKKTSSNRRTRREQWKDSKSRTRGHNDLSWLTYNSSYAKSVSRVPFGKPLGSGLIIKGMSANGVKESTFSVPGICVVRGIFTAGKAVDANSPINQAALGIWTYLRHAGTGSLVDDPNDVAVYFISIGQALACLGWLRRLVAELTAANPLNKYTFRSLIVAEGLDYDDLRSHMPELIAYTTWFAMQLNNLIFPKLAYFEDAYTSFHYVYRDDALAKGQYYFKAPLQFGRLEETKYDTGSAIEYGIGFLNGSTIMWDTGGTFNASVPKNFNSLKATCDGMLTPLLQSQFVATLGAAILKAYGESGLFRVADIDMYEERLDVTMDAEIQLQIHNLVLCDVLSNDLVFGYKSVVPTVESGISPHLAMLNDRVYDITFTAGNTNDEPYTPTSLVDMFSDEPSEAEVLLGTRLTLGQEVTKDESDAAVITITSHDTFIACAISVAFFNTSGNLQFDTIQDSHLGVVSQSATYTLDRAGAVMNLLTFTASPFITLDRSGGAVNICGTFHNPIIMDHTYIDELHRNAILSLFEVPKFK